jgi:peptidoglycan-associated lipoprotein
MKKNILCLLAFSIVLFSISCTVKTSKKAVAKPRNWAREMLKWDQNFIDYGNVKKGESRDHIFKFTNISNENIAISMCTACSCTTLDWTTKIVKPGESGEIITHFDSTEKQKSETLPITIILKNNDPIMDRPIIDEVKFHFDLVK